MRQMEPRNAAFGLSTVLFPLFVLSLLAAPAAADEGEIAVLEGRFSAAIVMDARTGEILVAKNEHERRQPASMLKMMTELLVLERIDEGDLGLQDEVTVSAHSSRMGGSQVYLKHGEVFPVEELLKALAIHSANDAAVALAEHLAGSVEAFVDLMNIRAGELRMNDTEFHSVHGLPPGLRQQPNMTSAHDMAILGRELIGHPMALELAATATAPFRGGEFVLYNPNKLVGKFRGLDGLKTGYHGQAGFCVTATAIQKGKRLISVVMGAPTDEARATETTRLLSYGFNLYKQVVLVTEGRVLLEEKLSVKGGKKGKVVVACEGPLEVSVPRHRVASVILEHRLPDSVQAPLTTGQEVGRAVAVFRGHELGEVPIVVMEDVPKGNWLDRLLH